MPGANNKHDKFGGARARSPAYIILNERGRINHSRAGQKAAKTHHDKLAGAHTIFSVIEWGARARKGPLGRHRASAAAQAALQSPLIGARRRSWKKRCAN